MQKVSAEQKIKTRKEKLKKTRFRIKLPWPLSIYQTYVGKKWVMALTGIGLLGFVLVHMIGNFHLYEGPTQTHEYAELLRDLGGHLVPRTLILWLLRIGLIAAFALHIHSAYSLSKRNVITNSQYRGGRKYVVANYASRTMRWTGPIIGLYLIYHLADLTWGHFNPDYVRGDPYHNVVASLSSIPVAALYIFANIALALHIFHGTWSIFQSLGINSPRFNPYRQALAGIFALVIFAGNISFPIFVQSGVIDDRGDSIFETQPPGNSES